MRSHPRRIVSALVCATATYGISQTLLIPSLPSIQRDLHASPASATSLFSVFFVSGAASAGIFGRLGVMFGKRIVIQSQMVLFSLAALVCGLSQSLDLL